MKSDDIRDLIKDQKLDGDLLISALRTVISDLSYAYIFDWIPEQGLTIYSVVVPDQRVAVVELSESGHTDVLLLSMQEYKRQNPKLSAEKRRKLATIEEIV